MGQRGSVAAQTKGLSTPGFFSNGSQKQGGGGEHQPLRAGMVPPLHAPPASAVHDVSSSHLFFHLPQQLLTWAATLSLHWLLLGGGTNSQAKAERAAGPPPLLSLKPMAEQRLASLGLCHGGLPAMSLSVPGALAALVVMPCFFKPE